MKEKGSQRDIPQGGEWGVIGWGGRFLTLPSVTLQYADATSSNKTPNEKKMHNHVTFQLFGGHLDFNTCIQFAIWVP